MIEQEVIDEIIQRTDIVSVVSGYISLKQYGDNFKGLCPFHNEKTPSFMVSRSKNLWHCFGCGEGGDVIGFLMKIENQGFPQVLEKLAEDLGINIKKEDPTKVSERQRDFKILTGAASFYAKILKDSTTGENALKYIRERGFTEETINEHFLGFAPLRGNCLLRFFQNKKISEGDLLRLGLIKKSLKNNELYDYFRGRLIFPIFDISGHIVGFGGRSLDEKIEPKYLNSPDTPVFAKGSILYGLNKAKEQISQKDCVMVVEGYTDVLMAHQNDIKNVVAPLGTSFTTGQIERLSKFTNKVILALDGDAAGMGAAMRHGTLLLSEGFLVKVAVLGDGLDPDQFLKTNGREAFARAIANSIDFIEFKGLLLEKKYNLKTSEGKSDFIREIIPSINLVKEPVLRDVFFKKTAEKLGIKEEVLRSLTNKGEIKEGQLKRSLKKIISGNPAEEKLLRLVLTYPEIALKIKKGLEIDKLSDAEIRHVFAQIYDQIELNKTLDINVLIAGIKDSKIAGEIVGKAFEPGEYNTLEVDGLIKKINDTYLEKRYKLLEDRISKKLKDGSMDRNDDNYKEYQRLLLYFKGGKTN